MDKKLQKKILEILKAQGGESGLPVLRQKVIRGYWGVEEPTDEKQKLFLHQLRLLKNDEKILKDERTANTYFIITSAGYRVLAPWYERTRYFLLYDRHNLFVILAFLVSIASLVISFYTLTKDSRPHDQGAYFLEKFHDWF